MDKDSITEKQSKLKTVWAMTGCHRGYWSMDLPTFEMIYRMNQLPDQRRVAKVFPVFKKGYKSKIENYHPISNLCSTSKILKK